MALIRFRHPVLNKMANGLECILLTEAGTWESFAPFAEAFAAQFNAVIMKRIDGADVGIWTLAWQGEDFRLVYDDFPNGITLEPAEASGAASVRRWLEIFRSESSPDGL